MYRFDVKRISILRKLKGCEDGEALILIMKPPVKNIDKESLPAVVVVVILDSASG